jgi:hypothetical protein
LKGLDLSALWAPVGELGIYAFAVLAVSAARLARRSR